MKSYRYQEYPKWLAGLDAIVQDAAEERRVRWVRARTAGREKANAVQRASADALAVKLAAEITALRGCGYSFGDIADTLNKRGILSARGHRWGPSQILRLLRRAEIAVATGALSAETREI